MRREHLRQSVAVRWMIAFALILASVLMQWAPRLVPGQGIVENGLQDHLRRLWARDITEDRIVVVDIDEASLAARGPWPWARADVASLAEALLGTYRVRAVGLDIVFPSPSDAAGDARLAALGGIAPLVFAQVLDFDRNRAEPLQVGVPVGLPFAEADAPQDAARASGYIANHAGLAQAPCVGNIGVRPDADGTVRTVPLMATWGAHASPLLPVAMLRCAVAWGAAPLAGLPQPAARWPVPYSRSWSSYLVVPASEILAQRIPKELLEGRWVLVGSSAVGLHDRAATPLSDSVAGVMVHAAVLGALLDRQEPGQALGGDGRGWAVAWTAATLLAAAWGLGRLRAWWLLPGSLLLGGGWLLIAGWMQDRQLQFAIAPPLLAYAAGLFLLPLEWWVVQRQQGRILQSFASYVAPSVLSEMLRRGLWQPMLPQRRTITALCADMQGYTRLTADSSLDDAARLTREFLQCLTRPVLEQGGTLDKYTGDGLVAFWGAPLPNTTHAADALQAARVMIQDIRAWNLRRLATGLPAVRVRIGIETGEVLIGDLGTEFRSTYTAVGDCINLASKLQDAARTMSCDLVVGPVAARALAGVRLIHAGTLQLGGRANEIVLWTVEGIAPSVPPGTQPPAGRAGA
jgi:adenylate cyclase